MKKLFSLFAAFLFVGSMWAGDEFTVSWTASSGALGSTISSVNGTATGTIATTGSNDLSYTWNYTRTLKNLGSGKKDYISMNDTYLQIGSNNAGENIEFRTNAIPGKIKSVKLLIGASAHSGTITVGGTNYTPAGSLPSWNGTSKAGGYWEGTGTSSGEIVVSFSCGSSKAAFYIKSISVTYEITSDPLISVDPASVAFGKKNIYFEANKTGSMDISVTGYNLGGNISAVLSGANADKFSLSSNSFTPTAGSVSATLTVSYSITEAGDYSATLTLSSENASDVVLAISLNAIVKEPVVYTKVTDAADLESGDKIVIVNETYHKAAGAISSKLLTPIDVTDVLDASKGKLSIVDEEVQVFTLGGSTGAWTLTSEAGQLSSTTIKEMIANGETTWDITITDGNASLESSDIEGSNLQYNDNSGSNQRFTTYTSAQQPVQLYSIPGGGTTAFDEVESSVKAVKVLRNGVLYIEKAGKTYNAQGQLVK